MNKTTDTPAREAKSDRETNTDGGESRTRAEQAYQTGLVQGTELPNHPGQEIPRVQATQAHFEFVDQAVDIVMISVVTARRLADQGKTAKSVFDEALVAVTTTIHDEDLEEWFPQREIQLIREFDPDFYVPCDRPVYRTDSKAERREKISRYLRDIEEIADAVRSQHVELIPLVKGILPRERARCYRCFEELGFDRIGYYCAQYFLSGNRGEELISDVRQIAQENQPTGMLLIGLQSRSYLSRLPPEVIAAAGQRWIAQSGLRDESLSMRETQQQYQQWSRQVEESLSGGQTRLGMFGTTESAGGIYGN
ncbi:hypothetical protein ACOZ4F_07050 [Haloarcula marismortui]|uniref:hypothetical protein n=1 Tax=Haloarcula marismortui TaxID=2238 RepID=UPI003C7193A6